MLLSSFKVGGYKVFGQPVELKMVPKTKNALHLSENIIVHKEKTTIKKNLKSAILYGGNNTGKSALLDALMRMKKIFKQGYVNKFPIEILKNFIYDYDNLFKFEVTFSNDTKTFIYGFEFELKDSIGEYLYEDDKLLFSRDLSGEIEGEFVNTDSFKIKLLDLPLDKLIVSYFLGYTKCFDYHQTFTLIDTFFDKIKCVNNRENIINVPLYTKFINDSKRMSILNKLIVSTELYIEERNLLSEEKLYKTDIYKFISENDGFEDFINTDDNKESFESLVDLLRVTSVYKDKNGDIVKKPSILFDSVGTNKFIVLAMHIISALQEGNILLIDEFESSFHHKLTRALVVLVNSEINNNAQFIMTSHDVKLLSPQLFRKDQINFILRDDCHVEIVSLDDFKANSNRDIRSNSNFEKMYVDEKIVSLPYSDIYQVIKEFKSRK
jgi:AAA15 family ATPase/GTPase